MEPFPVDLPMSAGYLHIQSMPKSDASRSASRSTTGSSVHTLNSTDQPRDHSHSDNHSISTVHTSFSSFSTRTSHGSRTVQSCTSIVDGFNIPAPKSYILSQRGLPYTVSERFGEKERKHHSSTRSAPARIASFEEHAREPEANPFTKKQLPVLAQRDDPQRRLSTIAPLPEPGHIRKTSARYRADIRSAVTEPITTTNPTSRVLSNPAGGHKRVSSYSLFPRVSSGGCTLPLSSSTSMTPPSSRAQRAISDPRSLTYQPPTRTDRATSDPRPPSRRDPRRHGTLPLLALDSASGMLGAAPTDTKATISSPAFPPLGSPCSISSNESDVKPPPPLRLAKAPRVGRQDAIVRQKSMSSLQIRGPPSWPPPNVPLPPLPVEIERRVVLPVGTLC
jgi:hypothetical protein